MDVLQPIIGRLVESTNSSDAGQVSECIRDLHKHVMHATKEQVQQAVTAELFELLLRATSVIPVEHSNVLLNCEDIFDEIFRAFTCHAFFETFMPQFSVGLSMQSSTVARKLLQRIRTCLEADNSISRYLLTGSSSSPIVTSVVRHLNNREVDVSGEARRALIVLARCPNGLDALFPPQNMPFVETLKEFLARDETLRFRVHELVSALCQQSPLALDACVRSGLVDAMLAELQIDDTLVRLNVLELLIDMATAAHCLRFLYDRGVLANLYDLLRLSRTAPDATFLFPAVLKFFGHLARLDPERCDAQYPDFLTSVFQLVLNYHLLEVGQRMLAFDMLGLLASVSAGKIVLSRYDNQMQKCMKCFGECIREGPLELRIRQLHSLNFLFDVQDDDLSKNDIIRLTERWFDWLTPGLGIVGADPMKFFFDLLKRPVVETRPVATQLFKSFMKLPWAEDRIADLVGFVDYVTSPLSEKDPENNILRFELVSKILDRPTFLAKFNDIDQTRLKRFRENGPYYKAVSNVIVGTEQG